MLKKSAAAAALFFITVSSNVHALGLGAIDMRSALNQPMNAVIDLSSASGTDLSEIKISIASQQAHDRAGFSRSRILSNFKFSVEQDDRGNAFVRITGTDAVHEPFLEFLLELQWPNGRLLREYTVLVDPPVTMPARPVSPAAPVSRTPAAAVQSPVRQSRPAPTQSATTPVRTTAAPAATADSYGPVRRNETLWEIAKRVRPDNGISMDQMMHALLRENPHAFMNNNINQLKAGSTLSIPDRNTITSITASEALAASRQQAREWKDGQVASEPAPAPAPEQQASSREATADAAESRLQLTAPEDDAIEGLATASSGDPEAVEGQSAGDLSKQLALVSEEAEASKAQSDELQSRVSELEMQIETMKRLLELKDDALAGMQQQVASEAAMDDAAIEADITESTETAQEIDVVEIDEEAPEEKVEEVMAEAEPALEPATKPRDIVNKLMDNPVLAGLGVLVAMLLGGFLWASTRRRGHQGIFDDEMTLEKHMANAVSTKPAQQAPVVDFAEVEHEEKITSIQGHDDSDPMTEADVYLAYGRIQQAEDVLQAALERSPHDAELRIKLLEVYHAGGNISAFDREASDFRDTVAEDDSQWLRVAALGYALSPGNNLYRAAAVDRENPGDMDFDMDLSGMDDHVEDLEPVPGGERAEPGLDLPESIEFGLDDINEVIEDEEDASEGLLSNADEVATKLDLARAYMDMGDPEGARSILDEVMDEGSAEQKREAEDIISQLG